MNNLIYIIVGLILIILIIIIIKVIKLRKSRLINWNQPIAVLDISSEIQQIRLVYLIKKLGTDSSIVYSPFYKKNVKIKFDKTINNWVISN